MLGNRVWGIIGSAVWIAGAQAQTTPTLTTSVATLTFQYQIGAAALPAAQTVQIVSAPAGATFTVAVTGSPFNAAWLLVSASSGSGRSRTFTSFSSSGISGKRAPRKMTVTGRLRIAHASSRRRRTSSGFGAPYSSRYGAKSLKQLRAED